MVNKLFTAFLKIPYTNHFNARVKTPSFCEIVGCDAVQKYQNSSLEWCQAYSSLFSSFLESFQVEEK